MTHLRLFISWTAWPGNLSVLSRSFIVRSIPRMKGNTPVPAISSDNRSPRISALIMKFQYVWDVRIFLCFSATRSRLWSLAKLCALSLVLLPHFQMWLLLVIFFSFTFTLRIEVESSLLWLWKSALSWSKITQNLTLHTLVIFACIFVFLIFHFLHLNSKNITWNFRTSSFNPLKCEIIFKESWSSKIICYCCYKLSQKI